MLLTNSFTNVDKLTLDEKYVNKRYSPKLHSPITVELMLVKKMEISYDFSF